MSETTIPQCYVLGPEDTAAALREAAEGITKADDEIELDFSAIRRITPEALRELEALADRARAQKARVTARGVDVTIYKVLKLTGLSSRLRVVD
jgi:anti-anti-sigma regulatory factor